MRFGCAIQGRFRPGFSVFPVPYILRNFIDPVPRKMGACAKWGLQGRLLCGAVGTEALVPLVAVLVATIHTKNTEIGNRPPKDLLNGKQFRYAVFSDIGRVGFTILKNSKH